MSLEEWQRYQPLSVLQLDIADRAVLRIAGTPTDTVLARLVHPPAKISAGIQLAEYQLQLQSRQNKTLEAKIRLIFLKCWWGVGGCTSTNDLCRCIPMYSDLPYVYFDTCDVILIYTGLEFVFVEFQMCRSH